MEPAVLQEELVSKTGEFQPRSVQLPHQRTLGVGCRERSRSRHGAEPQSEEHLSRSSSPALWDADNHNQ